MNLLDKLWTAVQLASLHALHCHIAGPYAPGTQLADIDSERMQKVLCLAGHPDSLDHGQNLEDSDDLQQSKDRLFGKSAVKAPKIACVQHSW